MAAITKTSDSIVERLGRFLANRLEGETLGYKPFTPSDPETLARTLEPGDVLLIEGNQRVSSAIKYLTQSTWSHAAFFVGEHSALSGDGSLVALDRAQLIEVTVSEGCIASPLKKYTDFNTRICRPSGLLANDRQRLIDFMIAGLGRQYDLKNVFDLLRYFLPNPPVPVAWRRKMLAFGSGDPTKAICSSLIAQGFGLIGYPILPDLDAEAGHMTVKSAYSRREILHIRHHSLYSPRDFDLSPYFHIVKPTLEYGFDYRDIEWREQEATNQNISVSEGR